MVHKPTLNTWLAMRDRCNNKKSFAYKNYGGRGINICKRWNVYKNFVEDMGERPPYTTLDRKDFNGNYEPSNCRWATRKQQANNSRNNKVLEFKGTKYTQSELAEMLGMKYTTLSSRLNHGMSLQDAITKPVKTRQYKSVRVKTGARLNW